LKLKINKINDSKDPAAALGALLLQLLENSAGNNVLKSGIPGILD